MNKNDELRAALADPKYLLDDETEAYIDEEIEALLAGFDSCSVPYGPESGAMPRPDFSSAAVAVLAEHEDLPGLLLDYHAALCREDAGDWAPIYKAIDKALARLARLMILTAWLGGNEDE